MFEVAFYPVTVGEETQLEQNPGHFKLVTEHNMSRPVSTQMPTRSFTAHNTNRGKEYQLDLTGTVNEAEFIKLAGRMFSETDQPDGQL
jgi:hypothetical protein